MEEGFAELVRGILKKSHRWEEQGADAVVVQKFAAAPREGLGERILAHGAIRLVVVHPLHRALVALLKRGRLELFPRRVPCDPVESGFLEGLRVKEITAENVLSAQRRQAEAGMVHEVARLHVVEQREVEAEFGDAAGVVIHVHAEDVALEERGEIGGRGFLARGEGALDEFAIALHQKRARSAARIPDPDAAFQPAMFIEFGEHEVHDRDGRVVGSSLAAFGVLVFV